MNYFTRELVDFNDKPASLSRKGKDKRMNAGRLNKVDRLDRVAPARKLAK